MLIYNIKNSYPQAIVKYKLLFLEYISSYSLLVDKIVYRLHSQQLYMGF